MNFDVVIPTYNDRETIVTAIESALQQELLGKVVVVDDGSTDGTADVVAARAGIDDRVELVRQPNGGPGAARNTGATRATATHLVFLDADDRLLPDALLTFATGADSADLVRTGAIIRRGEGSDSIVIAIDDARQFPRGSPLAGSFAIARDLFRRIGGYDEEFRFGENSELLYRAQGDLIARRTRPVFVGGATVVCFRYEERATDHYRSHRIRAAERMLSKYGQLLRSDRETLHNHHAIASELYRQEGRTADALRHGRLAIRARPVSPRSWARLARIGLLHARNARSTT